MSVRTRFTVIPHETKYTLARAQNADAVSLRSSARISAYASREWSSTALWMNAVPGRVFFFDPVALCPAVDPVPTTVGDPAQLLDIDVHQVTGRLVLVP